MKRQLIITLFLTTSFLQHVSGQNSTKDSIEVFYDSIFHQLETIYLFRNEVNWQAIRHGFIADAVEEPTFEASLQLLTQVFDSIGCEHCMLFSKEGFYKATQRPVSTENLTEQFVKKYESGVEFEVSVLKDQYGYITIPAMLFLDLPAEEIDQKAQEMYNKIVEVDLSADINGWIIDLRFCSGGDAYLMLASLYHLLGNEVVYTELDAEKKIVGVNRLSEGKFLANDEVKRQVSVKHPPRNSRPVCLLIGSLTVSAGEDVVLAFKDKENAALIGNTTYGFLTGNDMFKLPFESQAALTQSYIADVKGIYLPRIEPDIVVNGGDNFDDLLLDEKIIEAINWIDKHQP